MPSLIRKEKVAREHCGTQVTRIKILRYRKRCSIGTLHCTQCPNFSTLSEHDLTYHVAKKHSVPRSSITYKWKLCDAETPGFYALGQLRNTKHGTQTGLGAGNFDVEDTAGDVDDQSFTEELECCKFFAILKWRLEDTEPSTLSCHPSLFHCSKINWIMY